MVTVFMFPMTTVFILFPMVTVHVCPNGHCVHIITFCFCTHAHSLAWFITGVCQLVNKMEENSGLVKSFNRNDEQFLEAFVIFCGLGIQNTQMYEAVERAMAKQMVTLEVGDLQPHRPSLIPHLFNLHSPLLSRSKAILDFIHPFMTFSASGLTPTPPQPTPIS